MHSFDLRTICQFMSNLYIQTEKIKLSVNTKGAEVESLVCLKTNQELLWQGDPAYWPRKAPLLFPIVGKLKNNQGYFYDRQINLPQHGFLRDSEMQISSQSKNHVTMNMETFHPGFPFKGELFITHKLSSNIWETHWKIHNRDFVVIPFSWGHHPGFKINGNNGRLNFSSPENFERHLLKDGHLSGEKRTLGYGQFLELDELLFTEDALVFGHLSSKEIVWENQGLDYQVKISMENWPWFGIWKKSGASFICLEPWNGHADLWNSNGNWQNKKGLMYLEPGQTFEQVLYTEIIF